MAEAAFDSTELSINTWSGSDSYTNGDACGRKVVAYSCAHETDKHKYFTKETEIYSTLVYSVSFIFGVFVSAWKEGK